MSRIIFYCNDTLANIESMEYYRQDIEALRGLGHEVVVCNRYRDIPIKFDLMFVWWWTYALYPVLLARMLGRKAIIAGVYNFRYEDSASGTDYFGRPLLQRMLIAAATRLANANLFVGYQEFEAVPPYFALENAYYAPCAVAEAYFTAGERGEARDLLLNLAWSGEENLQRKGVWVILEAAALLRQRAREFRLILAGKRGGAFQALQDRISNLKLEDHVQAVGEVSHIEKLDFYARAKLYLQPSFYEGFGLATAEAMAAGCCVIVTNVGEVGNVVGDAGYYVQPGDPEGLADAIEYLLTNQAEVDRLNARASDRVRRLFSFDKKKATFATILDALSVPRPSTQT